MTEDKMQYAVLQRKTEGRATEFLSASHRTLNEKLIVTMQVCYQCKCTFPLRRGRKRCPHCEGTLRSKAIVPKSASF